MSGPVYVYGIIEAERPPAVLPAGVPQASRLRAVPVEAGRGKGPIHLVLADADAKSWSEDAIATGLRDMDWVSARALAHDEVLAALLHEADGVVPMKAFTLYSSEAKAIEDVRGRLAIVREALARVRGTIEWGLRLRFDEARARARLGAAESGKAASGKAFLERKKQQKDAIKNARSDAYAAAREAAEAIAALGKEARAIPVPQVSGPVSLLIDLAILAPRNRSAEIANAVEVRREALAALGVEPELTGPWAPFHFAGPKEGASR